MIEHINEFVNRMEVTPTNSPASCGCSCSCTCEAFLQINYGNAYMSSQAWGLSS